MLLLAIMFFSDPVTIWFRRKSAEAESDGLSSRIRPSISITEDDDDGIDNVFSSSSSSLDSAYSASSSNTSSKASAGPSLGRKQRKESKKRLVRLGRSVSICGEMSDTKNKERLTLPLPQIFVDGDSPHRLERSLSNNLDLKSPMKLSPFSRRRVSSPSGRFSPFQNKCFDFESIPEKFRSLQEEWRAGRDSKKRMSRSESARGRDDGFTSSRSSSWSSAKSPCLLSPGTTQFEGAESFEDEEGKNFSISFSLITPPPPH